MELATIVKSQKEYFNRGSTLSNAARKRALEKLLDSIMLNEQAIYAALAADLGKSRQEAEMMEVGPVIASIRYAIKNLDKWNKTKKVKTPLFLFPGKSTIHREPYGCVLIMSPWNYPFYLALHPLVSAIAAGNCVVLKTSKKSPATSGVVVDIINSTFERTYVYAIDQVLGYDDIVKQKYDYIFFTGNERVGKSVMRSASEELIPVTLELGGKSPCIVDSTANIQIAARKIMWGKLCNAGQTCVAPDYVIIHSSVKEEFIKACRQYVREHIGDPFNCEQYCKIISLHHFMRIMNLIDREEEVIGGRGDDKRLIIEPTLLPQATFDSPCMKSEIFGPVLPIITFEDADELLWVLKDKPKPLALYIFSNSREFADLFINNLSFGGGCVNDVIMHVSNEELPFGGIGASGMGRANGRYGFDTFTHEKGIYTVGIHSDIALRYPTY